jgi:flagellar hook-associated protein 2
VLSGVQNEIRSKLYGLVNTGSSTYNSLAAAGITTNSDGTLTFNATKFGTALATAPTSVSALFSGTGGVAAGLNSVISNELTSGGVIDTRSTTMVGRENDLTDQTNKLDDQMATLAAQLTHQYSQLNSLLSTLQSTSAYLTQQFAALPQVQSRG